MFRKRKVTNTKKILESAHMSANRKMCLNLNEGIGVADVHRKGNWLRRGRRSNEEKQTVFIPSGSVVT